MGVVSQHLLRQHLHVDVCVVELLPHLSQLTHGVVQVAFALTPGHHKDKKIYFFQPLFALVIYFFKFYVSPSVN